MQDLSTNTKTRPTKKKEVDDSGLATKMGRKIALLKERPTLDLH